MARQRLWFSLVSSMVFALVSLGLIIGFLILGSYPGLGFTSGAILAIIFAWLSTMLGLSVLAHLNSSAVTLLDKQFRTYRFVGKLAIGLNCFSAFGTIFLVYFAVFG